MDALVSHTGTTRQTGGLTKWRSTTDRFMAITRMGEPPRPIRVLTPLTLFASQTILYLLQRIGFLGFVTPLTGPRAIDSHQNIQHARGLCGRHPLLH